MRIEYPCQSYSAVSLLHIDLSSLDGLNLIPSLCDGVLTGVDAPALFGFHDVNVHGSESRNKSHMSAEWGKFIGAYVVVRQFVSFPHTHPTLTQSLFSPNCR